MYAEPALMPAAQPELDGVTEEYLVAAAKVRE